MAQDNSTTLAFSILMLIFALILLGIFSANVVYYGYIVDFWDDETLQTTCKDSLKLSRTKSQNIRIVNGIMLILPLVMIIIGSVVLAAEASKIKNQKSIQVMAQPQPRPTMKY